MKVFGEELRRLRRRAGLSQESLAQRAGVSPEAVSLLERGRRSPRMTTLRLLADGLGLTEADRTALFSTATMTPPAAPVLPDITDPLVGRNDEVWAVTDLMEHTGTRLVTLLGPSGVGKTRVALAYAARSSATAFPDGIHWLPAGSVLDSASVLPALAGALGVHGSPAADLAAVVDHLRPRQALLIVDNAEHHLEIVAQVCRTLLAETDRIKIIITSRRALGTPHEWIFPIGPLALPPVGSELDQVRQTAASRLFLARAWMGGALSPNEAQAVVRVCHRLDGLPLALELAAARTNVLTVSELADTLDAALDIRHPDGPDGGRQLVDGMVEWSYSLLNEAERGLFARLAVFTASFDRAAVTAVCGDGLSEVDVVDMLSSLVSKTMVVRRDDGSPQARFRLLQLIREHASARLAARPDAAETHRRHAYHYARLAERSGADPATAELGLAVLDRELANLRRALAWAMAKDAELAVRLVGALGRWCYRRGRYAEGRAWARGALAVGSQVAPAYRAPVLASAGLLAFLQCDYAESRAMITVALETYRALGDQAKVAWSLARLGAIARELGDYVAAESLHRRARTIAEQIGDDRQAAAQVNYLCLLSWLAGRLDDAEVLGCDALARTRRLGDPEGVIWALVNLGTTARYRGDLPAAAVLLSQALDLAEALALRGAVAWALNQLGAVARRQGRLDQAQGWLRNGLAEVTKLGDRWRAASLHDELVAVALAQGRAHDAARELGRADRLRAEIGAPVPAVEVIDRQQTVAGARAALGSAFSAAVLVG